jgi:hypothetical protein
LYDDQRIHPPPGERAMSSAPSASSRWISANPDAARLDPPLRLPDEGVRLSTTPPREMLAVNTSSAAYWNVREPA